MLWMKAFHLISIITWFAALFYLPRLFVYHATVTDSISDERFKIMERKLYRGIMTPSAVVVVLTGLGLVSFYDTAQLGQMIWLHIKLTLVVSLLVYHVVCGVYVKRFAENRNQHGHVFYRWFNELPVLALLGIVMLAVVKPF